MQSLAILLAPGAGAPSSSPWMQELQGRLSRLGDVTPFDYAYQVRQRRLPDPLPMLVATHQEAYRAARAKDAVARPWVFVGKSMGSRIGCHVSLELPAGEPAALICFGYPLIGQNGARREEVLLRLTRPVLFVQGSRDKMCPIEDLEGVRARMTAPSELHVVPHGDHSLEVTARDRAALGLTASQLGAQVDEQVEGFIQRWVLSRVDTPRSSG